MKFNVPTREQVNEPAQSVFDALKNKLGMVPNIYAYAGHSPNTLKQYLEFNEGLGSGSFSGKEREAVALAVAQINGCRYCQSAHSLLAGQHGFSEEEILQLRDGSHPDEKLGALTRLAKEIQSTNGNPSQEALEDFEAAGYDQESLVELIGLISVNVFTNYIHGIAQFDIDFPVAPELETESY